MMTNQPAATINTYYLIPITYYLLLISSSGPFLIAFTIIPISAISITVNKIRKIKKVA